jgi:hypothetical protein
MADLRPRSAGVTAAATLALLGCVSAFFVWGSLFLALLDAPADDKGRYLYQTQTAAFLLIAIAPPVLITLGIRTGLGLFQLRPWARIAAMIWAAISLGFCLVIIALRPFETFFIPHRFVSPAESFKQLMAIGFVIMLFPVSVWALFFFRMKSVKLQFLPADSESPAQELSASEEA